MAKNVIKRDWDEATQAVIASWPDGIRTENNFSALPDVIKIKLALHGLEQKLFDSIAGQTKAGVGWGEQRAEIARVYANLVQGDWSGAERVGRASVHSLPRSPSTSANRSRL